MTRRHVNEPSRWPSLNLEGNLISPAMLAKIIQQQSVGKNSGDYVAETEAQLREKMSTAFRVGQSCYKDFINLNDPDISATQEFVKCLLVYSFGFNGEKFSRDRDFLIAERRIPILVMSPEKTSSGDKNSNSSGFHKSAPFALQSYLNTSSESLWGLASSGHHISIMRNNTSLTRPAYIEANIEQIFLNEDFSSFAAFWLLARRSCFGDSTGDASDCKLEIWHNQGSSEGEVIRHRLAYQVEDALAVLGTGFLTSNDCLSDKLKCGSVKLDQLFNELLNIIYRLIFIMVTEDRNLLHHANSNADSRRLYDEGYSLKRKRVQCVNRSCWDSNHDSYEGIKIVFNALMKGAPTIGLPALGGLFEKEKIPNIEKATLKNSAFFKTIHKLSWLKSDKYGIVPVNWRDMETEELGSVYESLLELRPQLSDCGRKLTFASTSSEKMGNRKKTTGSYYTPSSLVELVVDNAMNPTLDAIQKEENSEKSLLNLTVVDPACGSGHFLLAAARRIARHVVIARCGKNANPSDFRKAIREVTRRCIHGVDLNPLAVELARVAFWIETVDPGLPLGFLDSQIKCGDALLGVFDLDALNSGIPDAAYEVLTGDIKDVANYYMKVNDDFKSGQQDLEVDSRSLFMNQMASLAKKLSKVRGLDESSLNRVKERKILYKELCEEQYFQNIRIRADLYISAFLTPKVGSVPEIMASRTVPTTEDLEDIRDGKDLNHDLEAAMSRAKVALPFHWPLEFPDIMEQGGFDFVIGNPPWERIKLQEKEFFAARNAEIANAETTSIRRKMIEDLENSDNMIERNLFYEFMIEKRNSEAKSSFARVPDIDNGRFLYTGRGDVNTYSLFSELFSQLVKVGGRTGFIVPTGIGTEVNNSPFFSSIVGNRKLACMYDFENREKIFTSVHRQFRFSIIITGNDECKSKFAFFLTDPNQLSDTDRVFSLNREQIYTINPNTKTIPVFRSKYDSEVATKVFSKFSVLVNENNALDGNRWGVSFLRMFDMSNDSKLFKTHGFFDDSDALKLNFHWVCGEEKYVPLYEAKMIHQYDHRWASFRDGKKKEFYNLESYLKKDFNFEPNPRYWISNEYVEDRLKDFSQDQKWLVGCRNITGATNERTTIFSVIPKCGVGHSMSVMSTSFDPVLSACLVANMNSIVLDYFSRQAISGNNMSQYFIKQFPVLPPEYYNDSRRKFVSERVLKLVYTSHVLKAFACDLNYDGTPFEWNELERRALMSDIDAFYFRAYGFNRDEVRYVIDPADIMGPDYPSETFRVLKENELSSFNEYRTQRLILEAWDRMESNGEFAEMDM